MITTHDVFLLIQYYFRSGTHYSRVQSPVTRRSPLACEGCCPYLKSLLSAKMESRYWRGVKPVCLRNTR